MASQLVKLFCNSSWQCVIEHNGATWRIQLNSYILQLTPVHNPNDKSITSAHGRKSLYFTMGAPFLKTVPSHGGSGPPSYTIPWPIWVHNPNGISTGSAVFAQMTAECPYTLQWDAPFPSQNLPLPMDGSGCPSNTWFPGLTRVLNPNGISIGGDILQGSLVWETDRPRYLVGNNRPHLRT